MNDQVIGCVRQNWSICLPSFSIYDAQDQLVLNIIGPFCTSSICCNDVVFEIQNIQGDQIGKIAKKWSGTIKEIMTDADNFAVKFPVELEVKTKAMLFATTFLIDFMFFEDSAQEDDATDLPGMIS